MLFTSSTLRRESGWLITNTALLRESGWLITNTALLVAYLWVVTLIAGLAQLLVSGSAEIGRVIELMVWAAFAPMYLIVYSPLVALVLVPYRVLVRIAGRPRLMAFAYVGALTGMLALFAPERNLFAIALVAAAGAGFAAIVRLPGGDQAERGPGFSGLNPIVRGAVTGLLLSFVWIVGSAIAVGLAVRRARRGALGEGGALAIAGTLLPGLILFFDLFREYVPGENYIITAALLAGTAFGVVLLGAQALNRNRRAAQLLPQK